MAFIANADCVVFRETGKFDLYGRPTIDAGTKMRCAVIKLAYERITTSVRADSSATRGRAREQTIVGRLQFDPSSGIGNGDVIELEGYRLRANSIFPRRTVDGRLDHYQVDVEIWGE